MTATTRTDAISVACPYCKAPAGIRCRLVRKRSSGRKHRVACHLERHQAARRKEAP